MKTTLTDRYLRSTNYLLCISIIAFLLIFLLSCSENQSEDIKAEEEIAIIPPPRVTILADLPDSLQPVVTYLKDKPKPVTKVFPVPRPTETFIDSVTGLPFALEVQGKGMFNTYTTDDGLALDMVHSSYKDKSGNLWFGTLGGGVSRYDGKSFVTFKTIHGLASNTVWEILEDRSGNLWFATFGGVSRYDGKSFTNFTTEQGLPYNDVGSIIEDDAGNLWLATIGGGVSRYDGKSFTNFNETTGLKSNVIWCIEKDRKGNLWFGTRGGGVYRYDEGLSEGEAGMTQFICPEAWMNTTVSCIKEDRKGNLWFGVNGMGLTRYDGTSFVNYSTLDGMSSNCVTSIIEDQAGNLWMGSCGDGLTRFDGKTFSHFGVDQGLVNNTVSQLIEDDAGNLWGATYGGGIFRYGGNSFTCYTTEYLHNNVTNILEDQAGNLWFGTSDHGVSRYDGQSITSFTEEHGLTHDATNFLEMDATGNLWISTYGGGVSRLNLKTLSHGNVNGQVEFTTYTMDQGLPLHYIYDITKDRKGNLWFASYGKGLSGFDGKSFTTYTTTQGLVSNEIYNIVEDSKGNLWFTSMGLEGMSFYDGKSFTNFTTAHGLAHNTIECITEDRAGNLWFATDDGLSLLRAPGITEQMKQDVRAGKLQQFPFETFTVNDGLPDNTIWHVLEDIEGNLIIGTNSGIAILKSGLSAFSTPGAIEIFNSHTGYPIKDVGEMFQDSKGYIWLATGSDKTGLVRFDYKSLRKDLHRPVVVLQNVRIHSESISWNNLLSGHMQKKGKVVGNAAACITEEATTFGRQLTDEERKSMLIRFAGVQFDSISAWYPIPMNLSLPYHHNSVTFDFNAIVTARNNLVRYQYMLDGYDDNWSSLSEKSSTTLGNVYEGTYTFKVKAVSPEGVWSVPISYVFKVRPPTYRTWWAYCIYGVLFLSLLYVVHLYQKQRTIRAVLDKESSRQAILNERLRISRDLHDEVGATLSGIAMYSHIAKEQNKSESRDVVDASLTAMQESAGDMVNKLSDIVWLLNPDQAQLKQLVEKLEEYARQMAQIKEMHVTVAITDKISGIELPLEMRRNIYLICKEAINNAIKYSKATAMEIYVRDFDHTLEFVVQDNGVGFDLENARKGNGLENMQKRTEEMGAKLSIESKPNLGTHLSLQCNLTH